MNQPNVPAVAPVAVAPNPGQLVTIGTTSAPTPTAPVVSVGLNWEVLVPLIFAGVGLLLTQVLTFIKSRENGAKTDAVVAQADAQTLKLGRIELLVDGRYGQVLQELADVKRLLAAESGKESDAAKADIAQKNADDQVSRVLAAKVGAPLPALIPKPPEAA